jgi:AmmeMemoRadiSam system protein B
MGIPSTDALRGQQDAVGFASTAPQMKAVWDLAAAPPAPHLFGPPGSPGAPGVAGLIAPHDDFLYSGRVLRQAIPLVTAKTVVLIGVFHRYRKFGARDALVFDTYPAWRAPDGPIAVSPLREEILAALPAGDAVQSAAMHDSEHSLEAIAYWLKHAQPAVEIVPVIVPAMDLPRMETLASRLGDAIAAAMGKRGWRLGRDLAIVISTDGVHYGTDFKYAPYGEGGIEAYAKAVAADEALLTGPLAGPVTADGVRALYASFVDPTAPDSYRLTWCGRFSVPLGLLTLARVMQAAAGRAPVGAPVAYATSVGLPELPVRELGLGETAPANLYHFVGLPAAAYR